VIRYSFFLFEREERRGDFCYLIKSILEDNLIGFGVGT